MKDTEQVPALAQLYAVVQECHTRVMRGIAVWRVLGLPALLALSGLLMSSGNADMFSIDDRFQFFLLSIPIWVLAQGIFLVSFEPLLKLQTQAIVGQMRALDFHPASLERHNRGGMFKYGLLMAYLYSADMDKRYLPPPPLPDTITEYYEACGIRRVYPYSRGLVYLEGTIVGALGATLLGWTIEIFTGRVEGGQGFGGVELLASQAFMLAIYVLVTCMMLRQLALLQALVTVLSQGPEKGS